MARESKGKPGNYGISLIVIRFNSPFSDKLQKERLNQMVLNMFFTTDFSAVCLTNKLKTNLSKKRNISLLKVEHISFKMLFLKLGMAPESKRKAGIYGVNLLVISLNSPLSDKLQKEKFIQLMFNMFFTSDFLWVRLANKL